MRLRLQLLRGSDSSCPTGLKGYLQVDCQAPRTTCKLFHIFILCSLDGTSTILNNNKNKFEYYNKIILDCMNLDVKLIMNQFK